MDEIDSGNPGKGGGDGSESARSDPLELFFDLIFVFAFTRIPAFISHHHTWTGVIRGIALLAVLWWAWVTYTWLLDTIPAESVLSQRVTILTATAIMFIAALAVPNAFSTTAVLFAVAYFLVRALHVGLTVYTTNVETRHRFFRLVPGFLGGPALLVVAGFTAGRLQAMLWLVGIVLDYGVLWVGGVAKFEIHVEHFVERYRDIVIIAFGESVLAMGFGIVSGETILPLEVILAAFLGIVLVTTLAWLYFDYTSLAAEERFMEEEGYERGILARNAYAYLHLPIIAGAILVAFGLEEIVIRPSESLGLIPAVGLYGGSALYLLAHNAFRVHGTGIVNIARLLVVGITTLLLFVMAQVSALVAQAVLVGLLVGLVVFETIYSPIRYDIHGD